MTDTEKKRIKEKRNAIAVQTVQTALENGFSMYDIEKLAASITCLAKFQKFENKSIDTDGLPFAWDS